MLKKKFDMIEFFRTDLVEQYADFIAIRREETQDYYVYKCLWVDNIIDTYISKDKLIDIIKNCKSPIVLSDRYIKL